MDYLPPYWLPNGHFQSIYPSLFRKIKGVTYHRERIKTPDSDFLDLDWTLAQPEIEISRPPLIILSHGLEGSSSSQYMLGMSKYLSTAGWDVCAWNFRSCGGEMNSTYRFYHSGATDDLDLVVEHALQKGYRQISLMGFSLGGNLTLKYLGERGKRLHPVLHKAVVFSAPLDLKACSLAMIAPQNRIYMNRFLKTLKPKVFIKASRFPDQIDFGAYNHVKTLYDFDHLFTAPIHGFEGADHYYASCSSMHFVDEIAIPTLIINAKNDPIVPIHSIPIKRIEANTCLFFESPSQGGHCGFRPATLHNNVYWSEYRAKVFLSST
ncbi:YheT family hydrolase [Dyadobacter tibetensis]|uniref:YheT family hydrolase n=1 Tax=Dyadobacter tibetensis TaxID=1211851 RepID=UPI00047144D2|nr:alpha/beta fold hydrolase [Dyadobacter tibetensis]